MSPAVQVWHEADSSCGRRSLPYLYRRYWVEGAFSIQGIVEQSNESPVQVLDYPVVVADADLAFLLESTPSPLVTGGQVKSPTARMIRHDLPVSLGADLPVIISPSSYVSTHASVGEKSIVNREAIVSTVTSIRCIWAGHVLHQVDSLVELRKYQSIHCINDAMYTWK